MARFRYTALDRGGKNVTGELTAEEPDEVKRRLREMGYFPSEIAETAAEFARASDGKKFGGGRVSGSDIVLFTRQLSDMTAARLPLYRSLSVLVEQADRAALRELIEEIRAEVQQGQPLSEALAKHPKYFPDLYVNMVRAGESSGHLDAILQRLAEFLEKTQRRRSQVLSALMYPAVLIVVAVAAVTFIMAFLVPRLQQVFAEMEQALPLITQILMAVAGVVGKTWWMVAIALGVGAIGLRMYTRTEPGREAVDGLLLRVPLLGPIWHKMAISRLVRTMGTMLAGGVPILTALEIGGNAIANRPLTRATEQAREEVRQGARMSEALGRSGVFPPLLVHMTAVGEETGQLPEMLLRVADNFDYQVDSTLGRLTTLLEPLIIVTMGVIVGAIVVAVLLPIFQISSAVGH